MKIENPAQAEAVERWIERTAKHIVYLVKMSKISSVNTTDHIITSQRLKDDLEISLITYQEEQNGTEVTSNETSSEETGQFWDGSDIDPQPKGDSPISQEQFEKSEEKTAEQLIGEADVLSSEGTDPEGPSEEEDIVQEGSRFSV